jgi:hypothetical protein
MSSTGSELSPPRQGWFAEDMCDPAPINCCWSTAVPHCCTTLLLLRLLLLLLLLL